MSHLNALFLPTIRISLFSKTTRFFPTHSMRAEELLMSWRDAIRRELYLQSAKSYTSVAPLLVRIMKFSKSIAGCW